MKAGQTPRPLDTQQEVMTGELFSPHFIAHIYDFVKASMLLGGIS